MKKTKVSCGHLILKKTMSFILSAFVVAISLDANAETPKKFKGYVGSYSNEGIASFEKIKPMIEKKYTDAGMSVEFELKKAGLVKPSDSFPWDFSLVNTLTVVMQRKSKIMMEPLLWNKACYIETVALAPTNSTLKIDDYSNKKILLFGLGYQSGAVLNSVSQWKLSEANLFGVEDGPNAVSAVVGGRADLLITDANFVKELGNYATVAVGDKFEKYGLKIVTKTSYGLPCRILSANSSMSEKDKKKLVEIFSSLKVLPFSKFEKVSPIEFSFIEKKFNWKELEVLEKRVKPFSNLK